MKSEILMNQVPTQNEVQNLIEQAKSHDLGIDFLANGALGAVAMTFGVHAFVVDAARDQLEQPIISIETKEKVQT